MITLGLDPHPGITPLLLLMTMASWDIWPCRTPGRPEAIARVWSQIFSSPLGGRGSRQPFHCSFRC